MPPATPTFRLVALDHRPFDPLFLLDDQALRARGMARRIATEHPGFPCRVSLQDAEVGDELLLLSHEHQPAASPYRSSGAIFVRRHARQRMLAPGEVPAYVTSRLISMRAYDEAHFMIDALVCGGSDVAAACERQFARREVAYLHLHNAKQGCFSCEVRRSS